MRPETNDKHTTATLSLNDTFTPTTFAPWFEPVEVTYRYMVFTEFAFGDPEPTATVQEDGGPVQWLTFETEREALLDAVEVVEEHILQFREGSRDFDEIDFNVGPVTRVVENDDGSITTEDGETYPRPEDQQV